MCGGGVGGERGVRGRDIILGVGDRQQSKMLLPAKYFSYENHFLFRNLFSDFGLSALLEDGSTMTTQCGSPAYAAPEIFTGKQYDKSVDIWSL